MTEVEIRLGQLPVAGEKARVGTYAGGAKIPTGSICAGGPQKSMILAFLEIAKNGLKKKDF